MASLTPLAVPAASTSPSGLTCPMLFPRKVRPSVLPKLKPSWLVGGAGGEDGALVHDERELAVFEAVGDEQGALDGDFFGVVIADRACAQLGPSGFVFGSGVVRIGFGGRGGDDGLGRDGGSRRL